MADLSDCLFCGHSTHRDKQCQKCECKTWSRADHVTGKALLEIIRCLADLLDVTCEQYPEAEQRVIARRKEKALERQQSSEQSSTPADPGPAVFTPASFSGVGTGSEAGSESVVEGETGPDQTDPSTS